MLYENIGPVPCSHLTDTELDCDTDFNCKFRDQSPVYVRMNSACVYAPYVKITRSCLNLTLTAEHTLKSTLKPSEKKADFDTAVNRDLRATIRYQITFTLNMRLVTCPLLLSLL